MAHSPQPWQKVSGGIKVTSVLRNHETVRLVKPNPPLKTQTWKKPKGVVHAIGAFGNKSNTKVSARTGSISANKKLKKTKNAVIAVNSFSIKPNEKTHDIKSNKSPINKVKNAGKVISVVQSFDSNKTSHLLASICSNGGWQVCKIHTVYGCCRVETTYLHN